MEKVKTAIRNIKSDDKRHNLVMFALDGMLITIIQQLVWTNVNTFAQHMGATPDQLAFMTFLNQVVTVAVLFPMGIVSDRVRNKKIILNVALIVLMVFYFLAALTPIFGKYALYAFIPVISFGAAGRQLYLATWNAFFKDATKEEDRSDVMAVRTRITLILGVVVPIITGNILAHAKDAAVKTLTYQAFIIGAMFVGLLLLYVIKKIRGGDVKTHDEGVKEKINVIEALKHISKNKNYMFFMFCLLCFYFSWQIDWTMWLIAKTDYLMMDEAWLAYANAIGTLGQFISIGIWRRINNKKGVRFGLMFGAWGLSACTLSVIIAVPMYEAGNKMAAYITYMLIWAVTNLPQTVTSLNLPLNLIEVVDEKYSAICISLYTILTTITNAIMPSIGVAIYNAFGGGSKGLTSLYTVIGILRFMAGCLWFYRYKKMKDFRSEDQ